MKRRHAGAILCLGLPALLVALPAAAAPNLAAPLAILPAPVEVGGWVTVTLQVTNHSGADETNLTPEVELNQGNVTQVGSPPAPLPLLADGNTASFDWTFS